MLLCVHHDHTPCSEQRWMDSNKLYIPRKNWSSWYYGIAALEKNKAVTTELVNDPNTTGKYLHRFAWLDDSVGQISLRMELVS